MRLVTTLMLVRAAGVVGPKLSNWWSTLKLNTIQAILSKMTYTKPLPRSLTQNLERNVCTCYDVSKQQLIEAYHKGAVTFEALTAKTYACQGSACCEKQVQRLIETLNETYPSDE